jgi:hypothetical protein
MYCQHVGLWVALNRGTHQIWIISSILYKHAIVEVNEYVIIDNKPFHHCHFSKQSKGEDLT